MLLPRRGEDEEFIRNHEGADQFMEKAEGGGGIGVVNSQPRKTCHTGMCNC